MIGLALKNIWKRKTRSIMTILGIVVAMQLYIILSSIMNQYETDLQKQISSMAGRIVVQQKTDNNAGSFYQLDTVIKEKDAKDVLALDNIDSDQSSMVLYQSIIGAAAPNMPPSLMGVGLEKGKEKAFFGDADAEGSNQLNGEREVILGKMAATYIEQQYGAKLGDKVTIKKEEYKIIGILSEVSSVIDSSVIMPLATAQEVFIRPGLVSSIMITTAKADKTQELAKTIEIKNPKLLAATTKEMQKGVDDMLSGQRMFFGMINNTIVVVAAFIIMIVMVMAVHERKKEIGTLKAIGASGRKILGMILFESLTLSLIGGLLALPVSLMFVKLVMSVWFIDISMWIQTLIVAAIIGVISGFWPAWSAQRVNPLESLRYE